MRDLGGRFSLTALRLIGFGDGPGTSGFVGISHEKLQKLTKKGESCKMAMCSRKTFPKMDGWTPKRIQKLAHSCESSPPLKTHS
jgi:hypothetical protein